MSRSRVFMICAVVLALLSPAAILAQDARIGFPVAVVALEGSYETSDDGEGCQLVWQNAGTPTLRVASSTGDRFRQDLVDGELVTLPGVDEALSCLFRVDVSVTGGGSYTISIEESDLTRVSDDDLEALSATMVLPVETGDEGEFVLATDDYIDLELEVEAAPAPGSADRSVPGVLRKVEVQPVGQTATPEAPGATPQVGDPVDVEVHVLAHGDLMIRMRSGCRIALGDNQAILTAVGSPGDARAELTLTRNGKVVNEETSPTGEPGCLFRTTMELSPADEYVFRIGEIDLAAVPFNVLASQDEPLLLQIDRDGNRTEGVEITEAMTPEAGTEPVIQGGPIGNGPAGEAQFLIVGQLDFWSDEVEMTSQGCAGGPGNDDIGPGSQVIVRNEAGAIIGYGTLEDSARSGNGGCSYDFTVTVPGTRFYEVELGDRGSVVYSGIELDSTGWRMVLETGEK